MQVVTKVEHGEGPFCKSNFTVSFFVPFGDQVPSCFCCHTAAVLSHSSSAQVLQASRSLFVLRRAFTCCKGSVC